MYIPFVDLKIQYQSIKVDIDNAIANVINETAFIGGKYVSNFANEFAELYGAKHCVPVANGTDAIYIIFKILGIGKGDEVITVANSWISSSETISQTGAKPIFVDIDEFYTIDLKKIEAKITPATKAILPVHLYGQMADVETLALLCKKYNIHLIEDCAQSHFSELCGIRAGLRGIASSFSFFPGKNLGAYGDAGCIVTNDNVIAEKCKMYANHGALIKHQHQIEGINSRLDGLQAAILSAKLPYILKWTDQRIRAAEYYNQILANISEIELPKVRANSKHTYHLYVLKVRRRDELVRYLKEKGIETAIHYPTPLPMLPAYKYLNLQPEDFPVSLSNMCQILSIPIFPEISNEQQDYIGNCIRTFYKK